VTSPGGSWRVSKIANAARRSIRSLDLETQERILAELEALERTPFSGDIKRAKGKKDIFRLRFGCYRLFFRADFSDRSIEILLFDKRGAIKDKNVQRL
jgi:mRNA-degrading endonuclease RelE of RelBE toxin-antitoxin system